MDWLLLLGGFVVAVVVDLLYTLSTYFFFSYSPPPTTFALLEPTTTGGSSRCIADQSIHEDTNTSKLILFVVEIAPTALDKNDGDDNNNHNASECMQAHRSSSRCGCLATVVHALDSSNNPSVVVRVVISHFARWPRKRGSDHDLSHKRSSPTINSDPAVDGNIKCGWTESRRLTSSSSASSSSSSSSSSSVRTV